MDNDWVVIASYSDDLKSQLAVDTLLTNGIDAVAVDKRDSNYKFGEIMLYVHRDTVILANNLIKDL
jgi:hypothetical protein